MRVSEQSKRAAVLWPLKLALLIYRRIRCVQANNVKLVSGYRFKRRFFFSQCGGFAGTSSAQEFYCPGHF